MIHGLSCLSVSFLAELDLVAVSVAATTATVAVAATAVARTVFTRSRFVDGQRAAIEFRAVELRDGFISALAAHLYKGKAL